MIKRATRSWIVAAAVALVAATAWAQPPTGTVKGSVQQASGPVKGARVVLDSDADSKYTGTATTDANGEFTVTDAPLGPLTARVYDAEDNVIATGKTLLRTAGETVSLIIKVS
jgi:hypothetical protein